MSEEEKVELFVENLISRYSAIREQFVGGHINQFWWMIQRIRPHRVAREREFIRVLREDVKFQLAALKELQAMKSSRTPPKPLFKLQGFV